MNYPNTQALLDRMEPDTPPTMRFNRIVDLGYGYVLEMRDPNEGLGGGPETKTRHQYARTADRLWRRRLPPESVGDEWEDGPARWELVHGVPIDKPNPLHSWYCEGHVFPLVIMRRLLFHSASGFDEVCIRGRYFEADLVEDEETWPAGPCVDSWWDVPLQPCPDCGGDVVWYEAGYVPGARRCMGVPTGRREEGTVYDADGGCGSMFTVDTKL